MTHLQLDTMPPMGRASFRALVARKPRGEVASLPELSAEVSGVRFESGRLAAFRRVCSDLGQDTLPLTAPHVLAAPLHMTMLTHRAFPMPLLGLVHIDNRIVQHRPVPAGEPVNVRCRIGGLTEGEKGQRFELSTEVRLEGELVWEETSGLLKRAASGSKKRAPRPPAPPGEDPAPSRSILWRVPSDAGRRYAAVSGDYNPIHLVPLTARLFGFKRAIVHGMWSLARCVAELHDEASAMASGAVALEVAFKTPILLPATVAFQAHEDEGGVRFGLRASDGVRPHLAGRLGPVA